MTAGQIADERPEDILTLTGTDTVVGGNGSERNMQQRPFDVHVEVERQINAPAETIYRLIADYNTHHPNILPPAFSNLTVEQKKHASYV